MGDYAKEYEEYLKAEKELYISQLEKEQAEWELEELKKDKEAAKQAEDRFREQQGVYQRRIQTYENAVENEKLRLSGLVPEESNIKKEEFIAEKKEMILEDVDDILKLRETNPDIFEKQEKLLKDAKLEEYFSYIENLEMLKEKEKQEIKIRVQYDFPSVEELERMPSDVREIAKKHIESEIPTIVSDLFTELPKIKNSLENAQKSRMILEEEIEKAKHEVYGKEIGKRQITTKEDLDKQIKELHQKKENFLWNNKTFVYSKTARKREFSFTKWKSLWKTLDEAKKQEFQKEIDDRIKQYDWTEKGEKPVESLKEYLDLEDNVKELESQKAALNNAKKVVKSFKKPQNSQTRTEQIEQEIQELKQKQERQKRFLKDKVIQTAVIQISNETEQQIGQLNVYWNHMQKDPRQVSEGFHDRVKTAKADITKLQDEYEKKKKLVNDALKKAASELQKDKEKMEQWETERKFAKKSTKETKDIIKRQRGRINTRIQTVNENNRKLNKQIEIQVKKVFTSSGEKYNAYVNAVMENDGEVQQKNAKSDYQHAALKMKVIGMAAGLMGTVTEKFRDQLIKATEAQIKGKLAEKEKQKAELMNRITKITQGQMGISNQTNQISARQQITQDDLMQQERMNEVGNEMQKSQDELEKQLIVLNQEILQIQEDQEQRIQENRERIDDIFREKPRFDVDIVKRRNEIMRQISEQVEQDLPDIQAGDQKAQHQLREEELDRFILEDKTLQQELSESVAAIERGSEKLKSLMTETNLSRIDLATKVIVEVCNIAINRMNKVNGFSVSAPINVDENLDKLEHILSEQPQEHIVSKVLSVGEMVYNKIKEVNDSVQKENHEAESSFLALEQAYNGIVMHNEQLKQEQLPGNLLNQKTILYDRKKAEVTGDLRKREEFSRVAAEKTAAWEDIMETEIQKKQEKIDGKTDELKNPEKHIEAEVQEKNLKEIVWEKQKILKERKSSMNLAFAQTVKAHEADSTDSVELDSEVLSAQFDPNHFGFLSKLTGVEMNKDIPLDQAMNAFGKIYINGLNAIDYFQLNDRYKNAKISDLKKETKETTQQDVQIEQTEKTEGQKLVEGLVYYGDSIRQALEAQLTPQKADELHGDARRLYGQMIAVEGQNMKLSGVKLSSADQETAKRAEAFNKDSDRIAEEFNKVRSMAADFEIEKQENTVQKQTNSKENSARKKVNLLEEERKVSEKEEKSHSIREKIAEAVHKSRSLWR